MSVAVEGAPEEQGPHQAPDHEDGQHEETHLPVVVDQAGSLVLGVAVGVLPPEDAGLVHEVTEDDRAGDGAEPAEKNSLEAEGQGTLRPLHGSARKQTNNESETYSG